MSNKLDGIDIKSHTYYLFDDVINIKSFDQMKLKQMKNYTKLYYLIINKVNG